MTDSDSFNIKQTFFNLCVLFFIMMAVIIPIIIAAIADIKTDGFPTVNRHEAVTYSYGLLVLDLFFVIAFNYFVKLFFKEGHRQQLMLLSIIWFFFVGFVINCRIIEFINFYYAPANDDITTIYTTLNSKKTRVNEYHTSLYKIRLQGWLSNQNEVELDVVKRVYDSFEKSDIVAINTRKGSLGIDFIDGIDNIETIKKMSKSNFAETAKFPMTKEEAQKFFVVSSD